MLFTRQRDCRVRRRERVNSVLLDELGQPETKIGDGKDVTLSVSGGAPYAAWVKDSLLVLWHSGKLDVIAQQTNRRHFPTFLLYPVVACRLRGRRAMEFR